VIPASVLAALSPVRVVPTPELSLTPLDGNTALRTLNVTVSGDYATADPATVAAFKAAQDVSAVGVSVDTTHGVVRTVCDSPFLFISPIVNRLTAFNTETLPNFFPQNTAACLNAGVTLAWLFTSVDHVFGGG
jgi:hypothetical protein